MKDIGNFVSPQTHSLSRILTNAGLANSVRDAKRLISAGKVKVDMNTQKVDSRMTEGWHYIKLANTKSFSVLVIDEEAKEAVKETARLDQLADMLKVASSTYFGLLEAKNKGVSVNVETVALAEHAMQSILSKMAEV